MYALINCLFLFLSPLKPTYFRTVCFHDVLLLSMFAIRRFVNRRFVSFDVLYVRPDVKLSIFMHFKGAFLRQLAGC
jgi:hypothetical protein